MVLLFNDIKLYIYNDKFLLVNIGIKIYINRRRGIRLTNTKL